MDQIMRELVRHVAGGALAPVQLQGLIRAGYVYRIGEDHIVTYRGPRRSISVRCCDAAGG
jgi:hypothetical protein